MHMATRCLGLLSAAWLLSKGYLMLPELYFCAHAPSYRTLTAPITPPQVDKLVLPQDQRLRKSLRRRESCACAPR
jgi:hypothetical protein